MRWTWKIALLILGLALLGVCPGHADDPSEDETLSPYFFVEGGDPAIDRLPLKETRAEVHIVGVIADVVVTQVYRNEGTRPINARYVFPASTRAAVHGMTMQVGEHRIRAQLELGADDYVTKPFSPRELAARAKAVLRRSRRGGGAPPGSAFALDEEKRQISYFGKPLDLSRYEYKLLCVLLKRPGRVYSRDELLEMVWDAPEASLDRTVDAHVKNLRAKLRDIRSDLDPIATHRGMGYSLKEGL